MYCMHLKFMLTMYSIVVYCIDIEDGCVEYLYEAYRGEAVGVVLTLKEGMVISVDCIN
jgi:hypothetical protein